MHSRTFSLKGQVIAMTNSYAQAMLIAWTDTQINDYID